MNAPAFDLHYQHFHSKTVLFLQLLDLDLANPMPYGVPCPLEGVDGGSAWIFFQPSDPREAIGQSFRRGSLQQIPFATCHAKASSSFNTQQQYMLALMRRVRNLSVATSMESIMISEAWV